MRSFSKKKVVKEESVLDTVNCDVCGRKGDNVIPGDPAVDWVDKNDLEESTVVSHRTLARCYDDVTVTDTFFDICHECFKDKLVPWLASQGVKPHVTDYP